MKRISLEELLRFHLKESYEQQYQYIKNLIEQEKIKSVKSSRENGKKPEIPCLAGITINETLAPEVCYNSCMQHEVGLVVNGKYFMASCYLFHLLFAKN